MRFFIDEEFIEDGHTIDLVSIGIACETGTDFYVEVADVDWSKASNWVMQNVYPHLAKTPAFQMDRKKLAIAVVQYVAEQTPAGEKPEFWGYYADYDWVCLCQLFGTMMDLPKGWPMYCRDIKQLCDDLGNPRLPPEGKDEHHALLDARWNKVAYEFLMHLKGA